MTLLLALLLLPLTFLGFQLLLWSLAVAGVPAVVKSPITGVSNSSRVLLLLAFPDVLLLLLQLTFLGSMLWLDYQQLLTSVMLLKCLLLYWCPVCCWVSDNVGSLPCCWRFLLSPTFHDLANDSADAGVTEIEHFRLPGAGDFFCFGMIDYPTFELGKLSD